MKEKPSGTRTGVIKKRDLSNPGPSNIVVKHTGSEISCNITAAEDGMSLRVIFTGGTDQKSKTIQIQGDSPVVMFCPSVEGTVILCYLKSSEEQYYDILSGKQLSTDEIKTRSAKIHFYG